MVEVVVVCDMVVVVVGFVMVVVAGALVDAIKVVGFNVVVAVSSSAVEPL